MVLRETLSLGLLNTKEVKTHTLPKTHCASFVVCPLCVVYVKSNLIRLYHQSYYSPLMFKHKFCLCFEPPSISGYCIGLKICLFSLLLIHTFLLSSAKKRMAMLCTYFLLSVVILLMILLLKTPLKYFTYVLIVRQNVV